MKAFAPVNIAWIKYMGKEEGRPANASLSMTLRDIGTETEILPESGEGPARFRFSEEGYVPPKTGQEKAFNFLTAFESFLEALRNEGFQPEMPRGRFRIRTENSAPAGTGIATSASGFAALTLAWAPHFLGPGERERFLSAYPDSSRLRTALAGLARRGSGSACRSFHGPFVEWRPSGELLAFDFGERRFVDFVLLLESGEKAVPSSDAHRRVRSSPLFSGRPQRAESRLHRVKEALRGGGIRELATLVPEEALDMHELFHTSHPPFRYLNEESLAWSQRILSGHGLPSRNGILTFDAGANAHLFVPENETDLWSRYLAEGFPGLPVLRSPAGDGAGYR